MNEKRYGRQEPTVGFTLAYDKTKGPDAIDLYEKSGRTAMDWQKNLIYDMLAYGDDELWTHTRCGYSVPRQNGKNEVVAIRELYAIMNGQRVLHTAHRTSTSRAAWERLTTILDAMGIGEKCADNPTGYRSGKSKGQEFVEMSEEYGGGKINFRTRTTTGGLGETYDLLIIDEAQEYQDDQDSALKYTIASSDNPQTIYLGTPPTPYSSGTLFVKLRKDILTGKRKNSMWAEWAVEQQTDVNDTDAWYETNPSLGHKLTERAIEDEIGEDTVDFNIQRLGLWIEYNLQSAITKNEWNETLINKLPNLTGHLCVGVKYGKDGMNISMSVACKTTDGRTFHETLGCRPTREGNDWIIAFLKSIEGRYSKVVMDGSQGREAMTLALKDAKLKPMHGITAGEFISANAKFETALYRKEICHMEQPAVTQIVTNCEKRAIGSSGGFGYKSIKLGADIGILDSIILAVWGVDEFKPPAKQKISY